MVDKTNCSVIAAFLVFPFFGNGIIIDSVHLSGHSPDSSIMLLILYRMFITGSPPAFRSSAVILYVPGDLPFLCLNSSNYFIFQDWWLFITMML